MKKLYLISTVIMILLAAAVAASVSVTYNFRDMQTYTPLSNVDTLVYPCLDSGCNSLNLNQPLPGSGNSGANSYLAIIYPTNLITPYGYAAYYFADGYAPQEYLATWHGNGATSFDINFNKIANCKSNINNVQLSVNTTNGNQGRVMITADVRSAFSDPHNSIGYVLPQYKDEFYSSQVEVRFKVYNSNNILVFTNTQNVNIYMDNNATISTPIINLQPGTYRAEIETTVTDNQCSNSLTQQQTRYFTIQSLPQCSDGIDNDGDGLIDFPADPGCAGANDNNETDDVMPVDLSPQVTLISPLNGTILNINNVTAEFTAVDDNSALLNCTIYAKDGYFNWSSIDTQMILNNTLGSFNYTNLPDGNYTWNVLCEDGAGNSAFAPYNFTLTINTTLPAMPECSDGIDNDGDDLIDFPADPGCANLTDDNETNALPIDLPPQVTLISPLNGTILNTGNITAEFTAVDDNSASLNCTLYASDGFFNWSPIRTQIVQNNTLGSFNFTNVPDGVYNWNVLCEDSASNSAFAPENWTVTINTTLPVMPQCNDGMDNDGDGLVDFPNDPGCVNATDDDESNIICTNHLNITRVDMGPLLIFEGLLYPLSNNYITQGYIPFDYYFTNTGAIAITNINYTASMVGQGTNLQEASAIALINPFTTNLEGNDFNIPSNMSNGIYNMSINVNGVDSLGCGQQDDFAFYLLVNRTAQTYECSDGMDNDGDIRIDAFDPGCYDTGSYDPFDDNENDTLPECNDNFDNDGDNFTDYPADIGCTSLTDDNETNPVIIFPQCSDGIDNDGDGLIDYPLDTGCINATDDNETNLPGANQPPVVQLVFPFNNSVLGIDDIGFIYGVTDDSSVFVDCTLFTNISGTFAPLSTQTIFAGMFGLFNVNNIPNGNYIWNVRCSDGSLSAFAPQNFTFTVNSTQPVITQCNDGLDNDGDGLIDMNDPGCSNLTDDDETNIVALPQCSDGIDNDGDGLIDFPADPGCVNATDDSETSSGTGGQGNNGEPQEIVILDPEQILYIGHIGILSITNPDLEEEKAEVGDEVDISVYIENLANYNLKELKLSVFIEDLGEWRTIGPFDLKVGEHTVKHVYVDIPDDTSRGDYDIRLVVGNEDIKRVKYRVVTVV